MNPTENDAQNYWNRRWQNAETGWDMGQASPPITAYVQQYKNKNAKVLIPGCGSAYEAMFMAQRGFTDITLLDIAPAAVEKMRADFKDISAVNIRCEDFFEHNGSYDLILEQTFFCAIPVTRRAEYAKKAASLLVTGGRLAGLLFNRDFGQPHPPFGGSLLEYRRGFEPHFEIKTMDECYNSIAPRAGSELFVELIKKDNAIS